MKFDRYAGVVFLAIGVLFIYESFKIDSSAYGSAIGPNVFPFILGVLLIVSSVTLIIQTSLHMKNMSKEEQLEEEALKKGKYRKFLIILAALILYAFFLEPLGFVITTFLFLIIGFQTLEKGKITNSIIISLAFSIGVYWVYVGVLNGALPGFPEWTGL
ncbi:tripartite tricarboxylate transporter TctB family protein [Oceanobacillus jeddahense]|uniref:tripartite tricarboxylate transporter TctB family protein n=1 Tax=Oceanobacillus jeddahense TaxID=1462527 RepID=UPI00059634D4|nr:tripartite tricarboxylate transporter TctB family protein [Oceanobacillus jeddahense]